MKALLSDHDGYPYSLCTHVEASEANPLAAESVASVVMVPAEGRMLVAAGTPCDHVHEEYWV